MSTIRTVATAVAGGRAKSRRLAEALAAEAELRAWVDARVWTCSAALDREAMACSRVS
ncbi:hypothetical protein [Streptomyces sp. NBC_01363]|uniref:hypothetical protein n=1 Tax=Streptomyces sp. NBC_01363 TaxID=2903840 RepID=UPI0022536448|nr:hypothetical protein [Streptomyces sp. NBC_01363]MCX4732711.1 hypothetical protein [Streptomyces sp. NBC_01363]